MADILVYRCRRCSEEWEVFEMDSPGGIRAVSCAVSPKPGDWEPPQRLTHVCGPNRVGVGDLVGADLNIDADR